MVPASGPHKFARCHLGLQAPEALTGAEVALLRRLTHMAVVWRPQFLLKAGFPQGRTGLRGAE